MRLLLISLIFAAGLAGMGQAQTEGLFRSVLVVDQDALFSNSEFGRSVLAGVDAATDDLITENRSIEAELIEEERSLTEQRATLSVEEFTALADGFDAKVQRIRLQQDAKSTALGDSLEEARVEFFRSIIPILTDILREERAVAILDKRTVLISINLIDVTDRAIERIDAQFRDGTLSIPNANGQE